MIPLFIYLLLFASPVHPPDEEGPAGQQRGQQHGSEADVEDGHRLVA